MSVERYLRHAPIKRKLTTIFFIITCVTIVVFASTAIIFVSKTVARRQQRDVVGQLDLLNQKLQMVIDTTEDLSRIIARHPTTQKILAGMSVPGELAFLDVLPRSLVFLRNIEAVFLRDLDNKVFGLRPHVEYIDPDPSDLLLFDSHLKLFERSRQLVWRGPILSPYRVGGERTSVFVLHKLIYEENSGNPLGICELFLSERKIAAVYADCDVAYEGDLFIANERGRIISHLNKEALYTDISARRYFRRMTENNSDDAGLIPGRGNSGPVAFARNESLNWFIVFSFRGESQLFDVLLLLLRITLVGILCLFIAYFAIGKFSSLISQPIRELTDVVKYVGEGNLDARADVAGDDEIAVLANEINNMVLRTRNLLRRVVNSQEILRLHELTALQSQISPHFLYNTLESVCALAEMDNPEAIISMVSSLSSFYRGVLSSGSQVISLKEELTIVRSYLEIMAFRYGDLIQYKINLPVGFGDIRIPKFTLQPIVENAIYHGVKEKERGGIIEISATRRDEAAVVTITDNGIGMSERKIGELFKSDSTEPSDRFGLPASHERIQLLFGDEYGIDVESVVNMGTRVSITVPFEKQRVEAVWSGR